MTRPTQHDRDERRAPRGRIAPRLAALVAVALALALMTSGCTTSANNRAAVVLIDISSEYAAEVDKARALTRSLLAEMGSGDSLAVAFIDNTSYSDRNFIARAHFGDRPSVVTDQKRQLHDELEQFLERFSVPSAHSDITGGVMLSRDFLQDTDARDKQLFLLSNLQEDLPPELDRAGPLELDGIEVVAVNVTREARDNIDPANYRQRLARWRQRVTDSGGDWRVLDQVDRLERVLAQR